MYDLQDNSGGYYSDDQSQQDESLCDSSHVDEIVGNLMHEIQGLQHELNGMMSPNGTVCEEPKPKVLISSLFFQSLLLFNISFFKGHISRRRSCHHHIFVSRNPASSSSG